MPKKKPLFDPNSTLVPDGPPRGPGNLQRALNKVATVKSLALIVDAFIKAGEKPTFDLCEPTMLSTKPRINPGGGWIKFAFNGGEEIRLDSAYVLDGGVYITAIPPPGPNTYVRFSFEQAIDLLNGFDACFQTFLEQGGPSVAGSEIRQVFAEARRLELEKANLDSGNHPEFGSW